MNIHCDLTFSAALSETDHKQSRSGSVGGNPDLSELIYPDDILVPIAVDLLFYIWVGNIQCSIDLASKLPYSMLMTLQSRKKLIFLCVQH